MGDMFGKHKSMFIANELWVLRNYEAVKFYMQSHAQLKIFKRRIKTSQGKQ